MSSKNQVRIEQFDMPHPSGEGHFQISVWRVAHRAEDMTDVPVLFVMDADSEFALAAEIARLHGAMGMFAAPMVVGVGYGSEDLGELLKLRTADLTPPMSEASKAAIAHMIAFIGDGSGGADALLSFITDELAPEIARRYPEASADNHALFGHSLGGLFVTHALLTRPESFATFLAASPSLWWDGFAVLSHLPSFTDKLAMLGRKPRVLLTVGGLEQAMPTKVPEGSPVSLEDVRTMIAAYRMVDGTVEFAEALRSAGIDDVKAVVFADEDHMGVLPAAMARSVAFAVPRPE